MIGKNKSFGGAGPPDERLSPRGDHIMSRLVAMSGFVAALALVFYLR